MVGITSQHYHYLRALERTARQNPGPVDVSLYEGDAVFHASSKSHPLDMTHLHTYTSILALDCAYHFHTRLAFLAQAYACLAPGGHIALADLCFIPGMLSPWTKLMISVLGTMPWSNIVSEGSLMDNSTTGLNRVPRQHGYVPVAARDS